MDPPHVVAKVALVGELPFTDLTFYVDTVARVLFLLVALETGVVVPSQTSWTLLLSCEVELGVGSFEFGMYILHTIMGHDPHQSPSHKIKHILFFLGLYFS